MTDLGQDTAGGTTDAAGISISRDVSRNFTGAKLARKRVIYGSKPLRWAPKSYEEVQRNQLFTPTPALAEVGVGGSNPLARSKKAAEILGFCGFRQTLKLHEAAERGRNVQHQLAGFWQVRCRLFSFGAGSEPGRERR